MTRASKTRSALFTSIISLLLCVSMLVGTTFAWFTDIAESGLNQIIAGNLDVALLDEMGNSVEGDTKLFTMPELWEPGAVAYAQIQVANQGNLDLKASLSINYKDVNSIDGHVLSEVLKYAIIDATNVDLSNREAVLTAAKASTNKGALSIYNFSMELEPGEKSDLQTLVIFWEPNADNVDNLYNVNNGKVTSDGQPLQISLGVKVFATQLGGSSNNEGDSFGPDYDLNAPTIIKVDGDSTVYATIGEAFAATGKTTFNVSGPIDISKMGDLFKTAGQNVTFKQIKDAAAAYYDFSGTNDIINANGASITIEGGYIQGKLGNESSGFGFQSTTGTITYKGVTINDSWTNENSATVTYDGCTFTGSHYLNTYSVPSITITNCVFDKEDSRAILVYSHGNSPIVANITGCTFKADAKGHTGAGAWTAAVEVDASYITDGATVNINGCTAEPIYNGIVRDKAGKNATITVDNEPVITSQAAFEQAIADRESNIYLSSGKYQMVNTNYDVTISGSSDVVMNVTRVTGQGNKIAFKGISIVGETTEADWQHVYTLAHAGSVAYEDCTIEGLITAYVPNSFTNCVFNNNTKDQYSVFCYGAGEHSFTNCTFNTATDEGKAIKLYNHADMEATLTVTNCTFNASKNAGSDQKAAIEIDSGKNTTSMYTVKITSCEMNENYTELWAAKGTKVEVYVAGAKYVAEGLSIDAEGTYLVTSAAGMVNFEKLVNNGNGNFTGNVKLTADVDMAGINWIPIGQTGANQFLGTFDGQNHTISNLTIDTTSTQGQTNYSTGLFGWLNAGTVKNVIIDGANIQGLRRVGAIAGYLELGATVENCKVINSTITGKHVGDSDDNNDCGDKVGGVVGYMNGGCKVINCSVEDTTIYAGRDAGCVVGAGKTEDVTGCTYQSVTVTSCSDTCKGGNLNVAVIGRVLG